MDEPIEDLYLNWLYAKVTTNDAPHTLSNSYRTLIRDLHSTEFIWLLNHDENRALDGIELRKEFTRESQLDQEPAWLSIPCSVLEMLIAFSRVASFETEYSSTEWFWMFLDNLGIADLTDSVLGVTQVVYEVMDTFIWRTYERNGEGGLFPLTDTHTDQRKVEIWYQFCEYLVDHDLF